MKNSLIIFVIIAAAALAYISYQTLSAPDEAEGLQVAASFYPLYFLASEIGGEYASVVNITPSGVEPHDYELTARDIVHIESGDLFIVNGSGFEPWADRIIDGLDKSIVVVASTGLADLKSEEHKHENNEEEMGNEAHEDEEITDPHVWLSPALMSHMADAILAGFIEADPAHEAQYRVNADSLKDRLASLDQKFRVGLAECEGRSIVTSHAAFSYIARDYGLIQVAISGISPEEEPSPQELAEVANFVRANNITHIFFETLLSSRLSETIAVETGAKTLVLNPVEGLTNDELQRGENYITVMEDNLSNLKIALQCKL